ncbi:hypothetical protein ACFS5L_07320 [Streptomyces phyllanthi]|uniref:Uncharacterized protein n=1 Tax=Streptomyces phyllanthi TaxID=1803180 RepID=A0A5N8VZK2_9ACTN|nr:hypothetical protein [Streptomyces phyllanthi]MPY40126.1 hypothetical protein [Streptomyces phyllanthi]
MALLRGEAARACDGHGAMPGTTVPDAEAPPKNEGIARDPLDHRRTLSAAGRRPTRYGLAPRHPHRRRHGGLALETARGGCSTRHEAA